jgi:hypothetical protein
LKRAECDLRTYVNLSSFRSTFCRAGSADRREPTQTTTAKLSEQHKLFAAVLIHWQILSLGRTAFHMFLYCQKERVLLHGTMVT